MPKIVVVKKEDVFPGRKVRAGIEPASCVEGHGSIPSMPSPEDVTRNQVVRTMMVPSTTRHFNGLPRPMPNYRACTYLPASYRFGRV